MSTHHRAPPILKQSHSVQKKSAIARAKRKSAVATAVQAPSASAKNSKRTKRDAYTTPVLEKPGSYDHDTKKAAPTPKSSEEKRLRVFRKKAPQSYVERLERAVSQRMFVIDRVRHDINGVPEEVIELAGTTGNIYSVAIARQPTCTCPDNRKGNQCKHIVYVLHQVLKAPPHLEYQLAFLSSELREIFDRSPLPCADDASGEGDAPSNRKPIEGDCPICFMPLEPDDGEDVVWCRAACGNNIHRTCFEQWATSQNSKEVRCVYCRTPWQGDDISVKRIKDLKNRGKVNDEGYVNIASELGMSGHRDMSTYHPYWVARQRRDDFDYDYDYG